MTQVERRLLVTRTDTNTRSAQLVLWVTVVGIFSGLLVMLLAYRLLSRELERRVLAEDAASATNERLIESLATLERTSAGLEALARYSGLLQNCRNAEEALEITARTIAPLIPGVAGAVYLLRASRDRAEQVVAWGTMADDDNASIAPTPAGPCVAIARTWWKTPARACSANMSAPISRRMRAPPASRYRLRGRSWGCWRYAVRIRAIWPR